jgi:hypothetical protein
MVFCWRLALLCLYKVRPPSERRFPQKFAPSLGGWHHLTVERVAQPKGNRDSQTKGAKSMALWEITTGRDEPYLYVELRGKHEATFDQTRRWWVIEANAHDALALYSSPGHDLGERARGRLIADGTVQEHARPYETPTG